MMIYLTWTMDGRGAPGGSHGAVGSRAAARGWGEKLTDLPLTLYSDPAAQGFAVHNVRPLRPSSSERVSVFDKRHGTSCVWTGSANGTINALAYTRAAAAEFDAPVAVPADNLLMTGGSASLADMIAGTERGLLLTTLWYIREVDPTVLLLTGLTRDGRLPRRGRRGDGGRQQLPVQRKPAGPAAAGDGSRRQGGDAAPGVG